MDSLPVAHHEDLIRVHAQTMAFLIDAWLEILSEKAPVAGASAR